MVKLTKIMLFTGLAISTVSQGNASVIGGVGGYLNVNYPDGNDERVELTEAVSGYGRYEVSNESQYPDQVSYIESDVTQSTIDISTQAHALYINSDEDGGSLVSPVSVSGELAFSVSVDSIATVDFFFDTHGSDLTSYLFLGQPDGSFVFGCAGNDGDSAQPGCTYSEASYFPIDFFDSARPSEEGFIIGDKGVFDVALAAGDYVFSFQSRGVSIADVAHRSEFDFSIDLKPVPVPGAIWLFASGLLSLCCCRKKSV